MALKKIGLRESQKQGRFLYNRDQSINKSQIIVARRSKIRREKTVCSL